MPQSPDVYRKCLSVSFSFYSLQKKDARTLFPYICYIFSKKYSVANLVLVP